MNSFIKLFIVFTMFCFGQGSFADEKLESAEVLQPIDNFGTILTIEDAEIQEIENQNQQFEEKIEQESSEEVITEEVVPIDISIADTIGIYDIENGGVDASYWQGRSYENIYDILKNINISTFSPAYNRSIRNIILSKTSIPKPANIRSVGKIARLKIDLLIDAGRFDEAKRLIQKMPVAIKNKLFSEDLVKMALIDFDNYLACSTFNGQDKATQRQEFWVITELTCLTIAYDSDNETQKARINNKINQAEANNITLPNGFKELILYYVFDQEINEQIDISLNHWTMNLMRLIGVGVEVDESLLSDTYIKRGILLNAEIDDYTRLKIAEEMFINDALPNYKLYQVYNSLDSDLQIEKLFDPETGQEVYPKPYQRYLDYKALLRLDDKQRIKYLIGLVGAEKDYMERIKLIRIFTPMLRNITPYSADSAVKVAKMFYAIGEYETANEWAEENQTALWFELALMEQMNPTKQPIVFSENYGVFEELETFVQAEKKDDLLTSIFAGAEAPTVEKVQSIQTVNYNPLAQDIEKRRAWMNYEFKQEKVRGMSGIRMGAVFAMLEAIGYKISDASWLYAAQMSAYYQTRVLNPAKTKALKIYVKTAKDPMHILMVARNFINQIELDDTEFAKTVKILYRAGFYNVIRDIMLERAILYL